ncbi:4-hydroxy-tetrahydrodipicolinate synthase [Aquibacillus koreensis]|uniref:4-hydroxy-tetrahydrodipicolinate synthase n=1 Tax=Aquibacillus koreensis TaxID=279446 RepID=A0A9X4AIN3_9BACI|nr:4-hydroxy-tetrahydrodipicolinate synthase [Aquibacillus koreensis]MCT2536322.1 4-hydroxy-tetrahydrodipicolinate synthase [Aquibacillus koreensis]MDC3421327.1 4-hydroxy-tetrahydrodipicolinate synthase [Aquibacillus koreensis]
MNFGRVLTAMVTPFDQNENIDYGRTERLINHLITNGTDALVVAGTTGESPTLSKEEKLSLLKFVVKTVKGRVPIIAGTGSNNTKESIELTKQAETIGVDGIMLVTPYYNKPSQEGMYQHFKAIANATTLPVMLYNIPSRSVVGMTLDTIVKLSHIENITSIKEASGDLDFMTAIIRETGNDFYLYSGDDSLTLPVLSIGGTGIVSVSSHIIGNEMKDMVQRFLTGDFQTAASIHQYLLPIIKALFMAPNPTAVKEALNLTGVDVGSVRLPLVPLNAEEKQVLEHTLHFLQRYHVS